MRRTADKKILIPLLVLGLVVPAAVVAQRTPGVEAQLDFGVDMAKRGLWSEALFRFQQAEKISPGNPRILNNLAVAYEAVGRFDDALDYYQRALKASPSNRDLKKNYSDFIQFYQGFKPDEQQSADEPPDDAGAAGSDSAAEDEADGAAGSE